MAFGVCGIIVFSIIFGIKYYSFIKIKKNSGKILDETYHESVQSFSQLQNLSPDMVRTLTVDEQYTYYTQQIQKYTLLRLKIDSSSGGQSETSSRQMPPAGSGREFHQISNNPEDIDQILPVGQNYPDDVAEEC